jgi:adenine phosphoribosyltransferase
MTQTHKLEPGNCERSALVRTVPDFPKPGILFYDITTLLKDRLGFATLIDALAAHYLEDIDLVLDQRAASSSGRHWPTG